MKTSRLTIFDETLRDGAQQVGLFFEDDMTRSLAHLIAQTGVHQIAFMPEIGESEERLVQSLIASGLSNLTASTRMGRQFIDHSKACGVTRIILFHAVSDQLLLLRAEPSQKAEPDLTRLRQQTIDKILANLHYAAQAGLKIAFAAEDASRADFGFLVECIEAFSPYLEHFLLCDTVGVLTPEKSYIWVHDLLQTTQASLAVHFHNDMGLALENTIQAVLAGATGVSGTFGGIGERAGNVALEQVLNGLRLRFGWKVAGIDYAALAEVTNCLEQWGIRANAPYSAQAQRYEAGIHVNSLLRDRTSYSIFPYGKPEIWFGKCSGASNFQYLFEQLQQPLKKEQYEQLRSQIKTLAIQEKRSFSTQEILAMLQQGVLKIEGEQ
ncbi:MAG: 2-isopropylmalate synthase [Cyanophyceae cyanobacterium]